MMNDSVRKNTITELLENIRQEFPFKKYISGDSGQWVTVAEVVREYTVAGDEVFDFGSGPCDKTAIAQKLGCKCTAFDDLQDEWHLVGDNVEKIEKYAEQSGIEFLREFKELKPEKFKMVMMNDVLEHIPDSPRELLIELCNGLQVGGYLFITVPNLANIRKRLDLLRGRTNLPPYDLYYWYQGAWRGPKREYVRSDLELMAKYLGFEIVELKTADHMLHNLPRSLRKPYLWVTALFGDWKDTWVLVAKKPENWFPKNELSKSEFLKIYGKRNNESVYD